MINLPKNIHARIWTDDNSFRDLTKDEFDDIKPISNKTTKLHRTDGPAIEWYNGTVFWFRNGGAYREDGPSYYGPKASPQWFINHRNMSEEVKNWFKVMGWIYKDGLDTEEKKMLFRLKFL